MFWDSVAGVYDLFVNVVNRRTHLALRKIVAGLIKPGDCVLECACGTGLLTGVIVQKCGHLTATDFAPKMLVKLVNLFEAIRQWCGALGFQYCGGLGVSAGELIGVLMRHLPFNVGFTRNVDGKGEGRCVQKDDMEKVMPACMDSDMIVFASPIYYFDVTAQLSAAIQRVYAIGKPTKATKAALLLSSASPNPYEGAIATYKTMMGYMGLEDAGIITAASEENGSEAKLEEIRAFAGAL